MTKRAIATLLASELMLALVLFVFPVGATSSVTLTWTASTTPGVLYNVYRETSSGACTATSVGTGPACLKLNSAPLAALTYVDTGFVAGAKNWYVVRSTINGVESANSNEVLVDLTAPAPPTGLTATKQ